MAYVRLSLRSVIAVRRHPVLEFVFLFGICLFVKVREGGGICLFEKLKKKYKRKNINSISFVRSFACFLFVIGYQNQEGRRERGKRRAGGMFVRGVVSLRKKEMKK